ncbi:hypothetical protein Ciccas_000303 [Cichlidogyrus casuarinus]|uniref:Uncharacterized protein n=1 Tax=Cichlidogyrus casuarinus TaxID=1844966 RepID=A0ABD2QNB4_9PLAT
MHSRGRYTFASSDPVHGSACQLMILPKEERTMRTCQLINGRIFGHRYQHKTSRAFHPFGEDVSRDLKQDDYISQTKYFFDKKPLKVVQRSNANKSDSNKIFECKEEQARCENSEYKVINPACIVIVARANSQETKIGLIVCYGGK